MAILARIIIEMHLRRPFSTCFKLAKKPFQTDPLHCHWDLNSDSGLLLLSLRQTTPAMGRVSAQKTN